MMRISPDYLPEDKLKFYEETGGVGIEFSKIPFDLLPAGLVKRSCF